MAIDISKIIEHTKTTKEVNEKYTMPILNYCYCYECGWRDHISKAYSDYETDEFGQALFMIYDCPECGYPIEEFMASKFENVSLHYHSYYDKFIMVKENFIIV